MINHSGTVIFHFHGNLNDFLKNDEKHQPFEYRFGQKQSIKDAYEALGVPHCEVALITVNDHEGNDGNFLTDQSQIHLYPVAYLNNHSKTADRFYPSDGFILDVHLGKLARLLRVIDYDVYYDNQYEDPEIAEISMSTGRMLLTRDTGLLKRKKIPHGYWVRSKIPGDQLAEIIRRFPPQKPIAIYQRCLICNGPVIEVDKEKIIHRLQANTKVFYQSFSYCQNCKKVYWRGPHYKRLKTILEKAFNGYAHLLENAQE